MAVHTCHRGTINNIIPIEITVFWVVTPYSLPDAKPMLLRN
jgi:hypothetical protein